MKRAFMAKSCISLLIKNITLRLTSAWWV